MIETSVMSVSNMKVCNSDIILAAKEHDTQSVVFKRRRAAPPVDDD